MRAARWTFLFFLASLAATAWALLASTGPAGAEDPRHPDEGTLAPFLPPPPRPIPLVTVPGSLGTVLDLSIRSDGVAVLAREGWLLQSGPSSVTWIRDRIPGSPDWLGRPGSIALGPEFVYVLDQGRSVVSVWDREGRRKEDLPIPLGSTYVQHPTQLVLAPRGSLLVTLQRVEAGGGAFWDLLAFHGRGRPARAVSIPMTSRSMVFSEPLLSPADSTLLSMGPLTHELARIDLEAGGLESLYTRVDPPLWRVPLRRRREYRRRMAGLGGTASVLTELPEFWPSVRDFTVRHDGSVLLAVTAGEDRVHVEHLTASMRPLRRLSEEGFLQPLFLAGGRAFLVEEHPDRTVVHELVPDPS